MFDFELIKQKWLLIGVIIFYVIKRLFSNNSFINANSLIINLVLLSLLIAGLVMELWSKHGWFVLILAFIGAIVMIKIILNSRKKDE